MAHARERPIRVCRVINAMRLGGVQFMLVKLLPALRDLGADPDVVAIKAKGRVAKILRQRTGIRTTHVKVRGRLDPVSIRRLARHFRDGRYDVVHTHMFSANVPATIAARMAGVPCIVSQVHNVGTYDTFAKRALERLLMPCRDAMLCVSDAVREDAARSLRIDPARLRVLHNAIDPPDPASVRPRDEMRRELGLADSDVALLHAARLHPHKNHEALLRELPRVVAADSRMVLLLAGDGRIEEHLRSLAKELGLDGHVRFLGFRDDVPSLMAAADAVVLPSLREGHPNVVLEAWQASLPVVATNVGGAPELVDEGVNGFVVPKEDMHRFGDRLLELAADADFRRRLGAAGREKVAGFSVARMAEATMALYDEILSRKGR